MKKKHATLLTLVCIAATTTHAKPTQTASENTQPTTHTQQSYPIVEPEDFSLAAQLTEQAGTAAAMCAVISSYKLLEKIYIKQEKAYLRKHDKITPTFAYLALFSLALPPATTCAGAWLLNYPKSRHDIYGKPTAKETTREWLARTTRNAAAHVSNQMLKIGTIALPIGLAVQWNLFNKTFENKKAVIRAFLTQLMNNSRLN